MSKFIAVVIMTLILPGQGFTESDFSFSGFYKNFFMVFRQPEMNGKFLPGFPDQQTLGSVNKRLRLRAFYDPLDWLSFHTAYELSFRIQDPALFSESVFFTAINPRNYRFTDLEQQIYPGEKETGSFAMLQNLDRFYLTVSTVFADIYLGRQAIAWGSARAVNPTDIIAPFTFDELDTEERIGVDALRIRIPIGLLRELDAGLVVGRDADFENNAFFLRSKFYEYSTDFSLLFMAFRENLLAGLDVARAIGGASFWLEAAYVFDNALKETQTPGQEDYFRASVGLDYSLTSKMYGFIEYHFNQAGAEQIEYHFNQAGAEQPDDYYPNHSKTAYREGSVYLLGEYYLTPGFTYQIDPLITFTGQFLINLWDQSAYLAPGIEYNISQNMYLAGGAFIGLGKSPQWGKQTFFPVLQSEFGTYPDTFYSSFRVYF